MKNYYNDLTVFLLTGKNDPNLPDVKQALENQTVGFQLIILDGYRPLPVALQEMINCCETKYYIQCDEDMVLHPKAIETMYNTIKDSKHPCHVFPLNEPFLSQNIYGIKIFNHDIMKKYKYDLKSKSASVELFQQMEKDGHTFKNEKIVVGSHSPKWTPETVYTRYYALTKKILADEGGGGYGDLYKKFSDRLSTKYNQLDLWALMGVMMATYSRNNLTFKEMEKIMTKQPGDKLKVGKIIDQFGWAFFFVTKDMAKYSSHDISYYKYNKVKYDDIDMVMISNPNISGDVANVQIPTIAQQRGIKVIGQYCGEVTETYQHADLIITISPQTYKFAKPKYTCPVIYLPESIDTNFFQPKELKEDSFVVGWAGREHPIKRTHILGKLDYPVKKQANWGGKYFSEEATLQPMKEFYESIDCLILTSASECQPRVIMEAMAVGLPVISTDVGSVRMLLDKKWIVPVLPEDKVVEEINKRLTLLQNDFQLRKNVGRRNRLFIAKNFSWEVNQKYWDSVIEAVHKNDVATIEKIHNIFFKRYKLEFDRKPKYIYSRLTNSFTENKKVVPQGTVIKNQKRLKDVLDKVQDLGIKFWVLKRTCLYVLNNIDIMPEIISIGVRTEAEKEIVLSKIAGNIEVIVDKKFMVKPWNKNMSVPSPVIPYLANMFGNSWQSLTS